MLTYTEMLEPIQTRVGPLERSIVVSQRIPFPARLQAAGLMASEEARVRELDYHIALRDTVADAKVSYVELAYLHRALAIVRQNQILATQLAEQSAAAYTKDGKGALGLFDTIKAQQQLAQLEYDALTMRELLRTEEAKLNVLMSRPAERPLGVPARLAFRPLDATREQLFQLAASRRQEIQAAIHRVRAADQGRRLAQLSVVPDFTIGVQYSVVGEALTAVPGSGDDAVGLRFGFNLPIWGQKNRARMAEALHKRQAARLAQQAETESVTARISKVYFRLVNAERLVRLYRESLIPQANDAMRIAQQWQQTGRDTFGRVLEARTTWLSFQLAAERAGADYEQMVARLEQLVGVSLGFLRKEASR